MAKPTVHQLTKTVMKNDSEVTFYTKGIVRAEKSKFEEDEKGGRRLSMTVEFDKGKYLYIGNKQFYPRDVYLSNSNGLSGEVLKINYIQLQEKLDMGYKMMDPLQLTIEPKITFEGGKTVNKPQDYVTQKTLRYDGYNTIWENINNLDGQTVYVEGYIEYYEYNDAVGQNFIPTMVEIVVEKEEIVDFDSPDFYPLACFEQRVVIQGFEKEIVNGEDKIYAKCAKIYYGNIVQGINFELNIGDYEDNKLASETIAPYTSAIVNGIIEIQSTGEDNSLDPRKYNSLINSKNRGAGKKAFIRRDSTPKPTTLVFVICNMDQNSLVRGEYTEEMFMEGVYRLRESKNLRSARNTSIYNPVPTPDISAASTSRTLSDSYGYSENYGFKQ